jgi:UDP-N-acetylmuramyl pentapeptide phosphotransferase/UDP-N-acetylglucosamine-1-phosphate transferase
MPRELYLLFLPFIMGAALVLFLVPPVRTALTKLGLVDQPSARRINKKPVPRGGGVALCAGTVLTDLLWRLAIRSYAPWTSPEQYRMFLLASALIVFVGFIDDAFDLKPVLKLIGQIAVALLLYASGISLGEAVWFDVPPLVDCAITLGWYVIIINAFNLIDGMDGLASGLALIGSIGLAVCLIGRGKINDALPLVILAGGCLGFLRYNFNPASIFLGDCGSMYLGLVLATVPLLTGGKSAFLASLGVPLLIMGVPLFDTVLAIWRRSMRAMIPNADGRHEFGRIMKPDMEHLHHRFLSSGLTQRRAAWVLYVMSLVMVLVAVGASFFSNRSTGIILFGTLVIIAIMVRHLSRVELWDTGRAFLTMSKTSRFAKFLIPFYVFADILVLVLSWVGSFHIAFPFVHNLHLVSVFPLFLSATMFAMLVTGVYRRVWNRADARDFAVIVASVVGGWIVGVSASIIFDIRYDGFNRQTTVFLLLSLLPVLLIRIGRLLVANFMVSSETLRLIWDKKSRRCVAYGAGERYNMLDLSLRGSLLGSRNTVIVALLDDDPVLRGRIVHGQKVLGGIHEIDEIIRVYKPDTILITALLEPENHARALDAAKRFGLAVIEWRCGIEEILPPPAGAVSERKSKNGKK